MQSDWIRVAWKENVFLVAVKTGRDRNSKEDECLVLKQFDDPVEAMKYGAALMDGIRIASGESFVPTDWRQEVVATSEALSAMTEMLRSRKSNERS